MSIDTSAKPHYPTPEIRRVMINETMERAHTAINRMLALASETTDTAALLRQASELLTRAAISNMEGR